MNTSPISGDSLLVLLAVLALACPCSASSPLTIDLGSDTAYLPYSLDSTNAHADYNTTRPRILRSLQVLSTVSPDSPTGFLVVAINPEYGSPDPVQFELREYPKWTCSTISERLVVNDFRPYRDPATGAAAIASAGYRDDTVFAIRLSQTSSEAGQSATWHFETRPILAGLGVADTIPKLILLLVEDCDLDGSLEMLVYASSGWAKVPRSILCVDLKTLSLKWTRAVSVLLSSNNTYFTGDSANPAIMFTGYASHNRVSDDVFSDTLGYVASVDCRQGKVLWSKVTTLRNGPNRLIRAQSGDSYFVLHKVPLGSGSESVDLPADGNYVSLIDSRGNVRHTAQLGGQPKDLWLGRWGDRVDSVLFVRFDPGYVWVFDTALKLLAQSQEKMSAEYIGKVAITGRTDTLLAFSDGLYQSDGSTLRRLLAFPRDPNYCEPVTVDSMGHAVEIVYSGPNWYVVAAIKKKSLGRLLSIAYVRNQSYVLMLLSGLLVGLVVVNFYRRRTKANLETINRQKQELERVHEALKAAQAQLVEQAKYKQAKEIAGGFAHEIRNALLPIESALLMLGRPESGYPAKLQKYLTSIQAAADRAMDLTRLISDFTSLDSHRSPEEVVLQEVIDATVLANLPELDRLGIEVEISLNPFCVVQSNAEQLRIVFTNLLRNSIDALTGRPDPAIFIRSKTDNTNTTVEFSDNGAGIAKEYLPRVFDTFFSTKPSCGRGWGLTMSRRIIEMYGGSIEIDSREGEGTTVTLVLKTWPSNPG